ncbi:MAG: UDP-N-acetylmuramoyl-L-alanyl-D-glutamate--2,6-diaminopimelate ligase [Candidatus Fermentibacteraceae bacterium]|nr:UDP-N-acetylmuramoyl-L-alanyl-D-glutamate--2,6-diaminopimelate ligase [Candidatus Fermentibacteraceae bacterium]
MKLKHLLKGTQIQLSPGLSDREIRGIAYDSRKVMPGFVFVAIKGFSSDGHDFVERALAAGASVAITEHPVSDTTSSSVVVNGSGNNRSLLALISANFYHNPWNELTTVGITGTNGKTSTAHILRWIMENCGIQTGIMGTVGHVAGGKSIPASVTTPDSLEVAAYMREMATQGDKACVMEVSSHALALDRVSSVRFDVTLFTNISQDHLDFHPTMQDYLDTKKKLFSLNKNTSVTIVGTYAPHWPDVPGAITFGERQEDTWRIAQIEVRLSGSSFTLLTPKDEFRVTIKAPGRFNVYNAAGAIAAAVQLGIPARDAVQAAGSFPGVPGRMERVNCGQEFLVAVDYAHTPDALERVLKQGSVIAENRVIVVFGCGGDRDSTKRPIMGRIAAEIADTVFVTSDNPRTEDPHSIIQEILTGISSEFSPIVEENRAEAIKMAVQTASAGDVLIIAGKGHEDYQILGTEKIHFDDREQARNALTGRGYRCAL